MLEELLQYVGSVLEASNRARRLSPFDPLLFAMLAVRAMALMGLGQFEEAAEWGVKAAARPNAHPHILACAAFALSLADRLVEAQGYIATVHKTTAALPCR